MNQIPDDAVLAAMEQFGGSFVTALARLYRRADPGNQQRLRDAFADYWHEYAELADARAKGLNHAADL